MSIAVVVQGTLCRYVILSRPSGVKSVAEAIDRQYYRREINC